MRIRITLLSLVLFLPLPMMADTTIYTYTGPDFTFVTPPYTTSNHITGSFAAATLPDNLVDTSLNLDVYSWNFTDGIHTFSGSYSVIGNVSTDATGALEDWYIALGGPGQGCVIEGGVDSEPIDQCVFYPAIGQPETGQVQHLNGTWTMVTYPTPEPSTLALVGTGILGLTGMARRRFLPHL
jgi:hypothetical protein